MAKAKATGNAIDAARAALTRLAETGSSGFEGLLCELLSAHLGALLRLSSSGRQYGRDMGNGEIMAEAKRYGETRLPIRELAGEIAIAKQQTPSLVLWILGTTQVLSEQDFATLDGVASNACVDLVVVDWSPASCPRLLTLISLHEAIARDWFERQAPDAWRVVADAIETLRGRPDAFRRVEEDLELAASGLGLVGRLKEALERAIDAAVADPTGRLSREIFGQRIDFKTAEAHAIERPDLSRTIDKAYEQADEEGSIIAVLGPEGVGKTWAVVTHAVASRPRRPLIFVSSRLIEEAKRQDWGHPRLLAECICRMAATIEGGDRRFRDHGFVDRLLSTMELTRNSDFDPIIVLDGFNERQGAHWASMISNLPRRFDRMRKCNLVVTSRPAAWAKLVRDLTRLDVRAEQVDVGPFSETEFAAACAAQGIDARAFDPQTARDLRNPRLFRIAAGLLPQLAGAPVTRERVFLEYWRHRQDESTTDRLEPQEFDDLLREHARKAWGDLKLLKGERTLYFDARATQEAARFACVEQAVRDVRDAMSSGFFAPGARGDREETRFAADRLNYVLGLSLHRRLVEVTDEVASAEENRIRVNEQLGKDLEPMFDTDAAGVVLATALMATCEQRIRNPAVSVGSLVHLLGQRNARNDEVAPTVRGMVSVAACADPLTFITAVEELEDRDPWLVEALRIALAASDDRRVIAEALHRWLQGEGDATVTTALHVLAGHDLTPFGPEILARHDPFGQPDPAFWLVLLDEASRHALSVPSLEGSDVHGGEYDEDEDEDEGESEEPGAVYEEIAGRLRRDVLPKKKRSAASSRNLEGRGDDGNAPLWEDESGHVPPLPPSMGRDWKVAETEALRVLARRRIELQREMHLFHLQLFENRLVSLDPVARAERLRDLIAASAPPPPPVNYKLAHHWGFNPSTLGDVVEAACGDPVSLLQTLGWFEYFDISHCALSAESARCLTDIVADAEGSDELRSVVAYHLGRTRDLDIARRLAASRWVPSAERNTSVSLHTSTALVPLCAEAGSYGRLRDRIVATILCDVVAVVADADLPLVVADFERHVARCVDDLHAKRYPTSRSVAGDYLCPEGSDRQMPLATLEMSEAAARRLAAQDAGLPLRWFEELFALRTIFVADDSLIEFLSGLLIGIAEIDPAEAARCLERLLDHLSHVMADADDAILLSEHLVSVVFQLPPHEALRGVFGRFVRLANDDASLLEIARAAEGDWRRWLEDFCRVERVGERPGRIARARTLQAMAGFPAEALSETFSPYHVERHARSLEDGREEAGAAARAWLTAAPGAREALEIRVLAAADGQRLDLAGLEADGEIGALFAARIRAQDAQRIIDRTGSLFGLPGAPTRFLASNDPSRVFPTGANRRRHFAERRV